MTEGRRVVADGVCVAIPLGSVNIQLSLPIHVGRSYRILDISNTAYTPLRDSQSHSVGARNVLRSYNDPIVCISG